MSRVEALTYAFAIFVMANLFLISLYRTYQRREGIARWLGMWRLEHQAPRRRR